ncbi:hypothetical protein K443DRAFT_11859 [Laccaria amethystina LaAM-08-1]|uniref:Uncharacterized protein n=1 Tax=Laccaria amethystina LaAM-08-1 TaxID=1095629 RepID=A0A0C9WSP1_9AGAR|nr:hypothetical protein K443DRAFT_11859 [Laccaria amethystina LaAM-08-1]
MPKLVSNICAPVLSFYIRSHYAISYINQTCTPLTSHCPMIQGTLVLNVLKPPSSQPPIIHSMLYPSRNSSYQG